MSEKIQCSERVWHNEGNWGSNVPCRRSANVDRDGKWYCAVHDPEKVRARREKAAEAERQERERRDATVERAKALIGRLGMGYVDYLKNEAWGVALNFTDAEKLVDTLETLRELARVVKLYDDGDGSQGAWNGLGGHHEGCAIYDPVQAGDCDCGWHVIEEALAEVQKLPG